MTQAYGTEAVISTKYVSVPSLVLKLRELLTILLYSIRNLNHYLYQYGHNIISFEWLRYPSFERHKRNTRESYHVCNAEMRLIIICVVELAVSARL